MIRIAFDVDGCLITLDGDKPKYETINMLRKFYHLWVKTGQAEIFVWSGGGNDYAARWVDKLGLGPLVKVIEKGGRDDIDICFDDETVTLGKVNLRV